ncbi:MAG TPA: DEAD/DEAH box helicase, partial [Actinomycetales bacterium]|nr:DEAD/DEAH box helicase [Actinomycetales bacterium]
PAAPSSTETTTPALRFADLGLPGQLVDRLARDGLTTAFPIQSATIPDALSGRDVLGRAQTGSGKTLAFGLPLLTRLASRRSESRHPRGIVLVPTRELAMQVHDSLEPLAHVLGVRIKLVAGGLPYQKQIHALDRGVDVLVATPGRLTDLVQRGSCHLSSVEVLVLDEADQMCDMGFLPDVCALLDQMPTSGQRLLFSATLDGDVEQIVRRYLHDPVQHATNDAGATVSTMSHHVWLVKPAHKGPLTTALAARRGRTVVFVRTKLGADRVAAQLREQGVRAAALHGGLPQGARNRTLSAFRDGHVPVLVATDVAARGIHVDDVGLVLQVDPPADHKDYLHRAGRTARAGEQGTVITLALPHQRRTMERLTGSAGVTATAVPVGPRDQLVHDVTGGAEPSGVKVEEHELFPPKPVRRSGPRRGRRDTDGRPRREHQREQRPDSRAGSWSDRSEHRAESRPQRRADGRPQRRGENRPQRQGTSRRPPRPTSRRAG